MNAIRPSLLKFVKNKGKKSGNLNIIDNSIPLFIFKITLVSNSDMKFHQKTEFQVVHYCTAGVRKKIKKLLKKILF